MPRHTEPSVNDAMGLLLQTMLSRSSVRSENTRAIAGRPGLRPDILITAPGSSPVVVEAEYLPAATVEEEATSRIGLGRCKPTLRSHRSRHRTAAIRLNR